MADDRQLRVSDAERESTAETLRDACAAGRLDPAELDERLTAAYAARTRGDLADLLADLPPAGAPPIAPEEVDTARVRREHQRRTVANRALGGLSAFLVCTVIWAATGAQGSFWPMWVGIAVVLGIVGSLPKLLEASTDEDDIRQDLARSAEREQRRSKGR